MKERIDLKILLTELAEKIKEFYPYFFSFYLLSLIVSIFSLTWRGFFYWPAFHCSLILFTIVFILSFYQRIISFFIVNFGHFFNAGTDPLAFKKICKTLSFLILDNLRRYLIFTRKKLLLVKKSTWLKIIIIAVLLIFSLVRGIGVLDFFVLFYALISFLFILDSRLAAGLALILLASCPFFLILKKELLAESAAVYAYYFLVITVLTQIRELVRDKR